MDLRDCRFGVQTERMVDYARFDSCNFSASLRRGCLKRRVARAAGRAFGQGARYAAQALLVAAAGAVFAYSAVYVTRAVACTTAQKEPAKPLQAGSPVRLERS